MHIANMGVCFTNTDLQAKHDATRELRFLLAHMDKDPNAGEDSDERIYSGPNDVVIADLLERVFPYSRTLKAVKMCCLQPLNSVSSAAVTFVSE